MSAEIQLLTVSDQADARLDAYLAARLPDISRTRIQRAIEDGDVLVNERATKPSYRVRVGDQIEIDLPDPPPLALAAEAIPLTLLFEDDDLLVVDKPANLVVHPGAGVQTGTLANALVYHFEHLSERGGQIRPGIVHRIDKETSGLLVVAKNDFTHERLSEQFRARTVFKQYTALVYGRMSQEQGEITASIGRSPHHRTRMAVLKGGAGRTAHTRFAVARRLAEFTLLDVQIKTGRTHQIRVHLAHLGHPVVGDSVYGAGRENSLRDAPIKRAVNGLERHFLHASELAFDHPRTGERLHFQSPLPAELKQFLAELG